MSTYSHKPSVLLNALRKYSIPDVIIGGNKDCKHVFNLKDMELGHENRQGISSNILNAGTQSHVGVHGKKVGKQGICIHCGSWKGQYGLEQTPAAYVEHTRLWAKEAWRVLRNDGIMMINLGDSYASGGGKAVEQSMKRQSAIDTGAYPDYSPAAKLRQTMPKCQLLIPHRVAIALIESDDNDIYEINNDLTDSQCVAIISEILQHNQGEYNGKNNKMQEM